MLPRALCSQNKDQRCHLLKNEPNLAIKPVSMSGCNITPLGNNPKKLNFQYHSYFIVYSGTNLFQTPLGQICVLITGVSSIQGLIYIMSTV